MGLGGVHVMRCAFHFSPLSARPADINRPTAVRQSTGSAMMAAIPHRGSSPLLDSSHRQESFHSASRAVHSNVWSGSFSILRLPSVLSRTMNP